VEIESEGLRSEWNCLIFKRWWSFKVVNEFIFLLVSVEINLNKVLEVIE
jgi:hypothetical protein